MWNMIKNHFTKDPVPSLGDWSLIGCVVVPAFNYKDFELAAPDWNPKNFNQDI